MKQYLLSLLAIFMTITNDVLASELIPLRAWRYSPADKAEWRACTVPSTIQDLLFAEGLIPNPHYRTNERLVQWVGERDWLYEGEFEVPEVRTMDARERFELELDGIDTYSDIYINGRLVGSTENMFLAYRFDLTPHIQRGKNILRIQLKSPLRMAEPACRRAGFNYPADNDHAETKYSVFTRKAPYHYGWDWGMRLITMGIWQPLRLRHYRGEDVRLIDWQVRSEVVWRGDKAVGAKLSVAIETEPKQGAIAMELYDPAGKLLRSWTGRQEGGVFPVEHYLEDVELWQPRGWGKQALYTLRLKLNKGKQVESKQIGFRTVELKHQPNSPEGQSSFYFEVNKKPFFVRGANYIPGENMLTRRTDADFERLFRDAEFANMNMLRVWGGGVYEDARFYQEADKRGILIWQDFMFACTAYPADSAFLRNVEAEASYQVKRLSHHPSIVLWCGNNEVEEAIKYWGWQKRFTPKQYQRMSEDYDPIFRRVLPEVLAKYYPNMPYIHSSPTSANWGRPKTWLEGDSHYWGLWYGGEPFETFDEKKFAFVSEFGFQSFPDVPSLRQFALPEDMSLDSEVMRQHQKASTGNSLIRRYMEQYYQVPERFEDFVYIGQVMQARGMEHAVRAMRRHRPTTMGSLVWQLNDAWPAVSWSSIDYYQNYKALHYTLRRAFQPVTLLPYRREGSDSLAVYIANDSLEDLEQLWLKVELRSFDGELLWARNVPRGTYPANATSFLGRFDLSQYLARRDVYVNLVYGISDMCLVSTQKWYPHKPKDMDLPRAEYEWSLESAQDMPEVGCSPKVYRYKLTVKAKTFVKDLWVSSDVMGVRYSDNLLDLTKGGRAVIVVENPLPLTRANFHLRSLN